MKERVISFGSWRLYYFIPEFLFLFIPSSNHLTWRGVELRITTISVLGLIEQVMGFLL